MSVTLGFMTVSLVKVKASAPNIVWSLFMETATVISMGTSSVTKVTLQLCFFFTEIIDRRIYHYEHAILL